MQGKRIIIAVIVLTVAILACTNPLQAVTTPASPVNVETIVAMTFQALTAPAPETGVTLPPSTSVLLPRSLYFLNNDNAGLLQVYRLEKDGVTLKQITFEPANVDSYDPSPLDGSVVYVSNNLLLLVNADGSNRRVLLEGGAIDENNPFVNRIVNPVWSPNGQTIAYGHKGLNLYSVSNGQSNLVLENQLRDPSSDFVFPEELYWPSSYSPDGGKLLVTLAYYEGSSAAIYYPNGNALVRLTGDAKGEISGPLQWTSDSTALYTGRATMGMFGPGLWRVDAASGAVTTLLPGDAGNNTFNLADRPMLGPDGQLYFFFTNQPAPDGMINRGPLQLVRSAPDAVTGRTSIRPETFELMNEALWAPDASFVIVASAPIQDVYQGGIAELFYTAGQKAAVPLVDFALNMKWGP